MTYTKNNFINVPNSPDDNQKRFQGLIFGSRGGSFAEIFPYNKKESILEKVKEILSKSKNYKFATLFQ